MLSLNYIKTKYRVKRLVYKNIVAEAGFEPAILSL